MKKAYYICLTLILLSQLNAQTISPIEKKFGKLQISVDPRLELLSVVQVLADYKVTDNEADYAVDIKKFFDKNTSMDAVKLTKKLSSNDFGFDAPVTFMLLHTQPPEFKQNYPFSEYLEQRAGGIENLQKYEEALAAFAQNTPFREFWNSKKDYYQKIVDYSSAEITNTDLSAILESYYNETRNSYNILIAPAFKGGYGPDLKAPNGGYDIYSCSGATDIMDSIPYLSRISMLKLVWHEFSHSFVNPLTSQYLSEVNRLEYLFDPIKDEMKKHAYKSWRTCVNEHIVRAVNIRLAELNLSPKTAVDRLEYEKEKGFIYIEQIIEKLKEFEKERKEKNITFSEYFPRLLEAFKHITP